MKEVADFLTRLTPIGKVIIFGGFILFLLVSYLIIKPDPVPESSYDSNTPVNLAYNYPFRNNSEKEAFLKDPLHVTVTDPCFNGGALATFSELGYSAARIQSPDREVPFSFDAYIPADYVKNPYYYSDPNGDEEYIPAYYVQPDGQGATKAQEFAQENYDNLPSCIEPPGLDSAGGIFLLAFKKGQTPSSSFVHIDGSMWFDALGVNPNIINATNPETGEGPANVPVIKVGNYDNITASQAQDPANNIQILNTAIQAGPGIIRVGRVEYGNQNTRVWIQLINRGTIALDAWSGIYNTCLKSAGGSCLTPVDITEQTEESQSLSLNEGIPDEPVPASTGTQGGVLEGYLVFPRVSRDKPLQLQLPNLTIGDNIDESRPLVIDLVN